MTGGCKPGITDVELVCSQEHDMVAVSFLLEFNVVWNMIWLMCPCYGTLM